MKIKLIQVLFMAVISISCSIKHNQSSVRNNDDNVTNTIIIDQSNFSKLSKVIERVFLTPSGRALARHTYLLDDK